MAMLEKRVPSRLRASASSTIQRASSVSDSPSNTRTGSPGFAVIWTTTPWTLPGNQALNVHPDVLYNLVDTPKGLQLPHPFQPLARRQERVQEGRRRLPLVPGRLDQARGGADAVLRADDQLL